MKAEDAERLASLPARVPNGPVIDKALELFQDQDVQQALSMMINKFGAKMAEMNQEEEDNDEDEDDTTEPSFF